MSHRVLVINPNSSAACTAGMAEAIAGLGLGDQVAVTDLPEGPPAIRTWADWFAVAEPLAARIAREQAGAYVIGCVSDPGLELARTVTPRPVLGMMRCAVAAALTRGERFGIVGFVETSRPRQRRVLQAMGLEARLAGWEPMNLPMETLTEPEAPRARLVEVAKLLAAQGAEVLVLGCTGLARHAAAAEDAAGLPVIEPCRAAVLAARLALA
jgi:Asp/Glu/hydantoin racemase